MSENGATSASQAANAVNFVQTGSAALGGIVDSIIFLILVTLLENLKLQRY